MFVVSDAPNKEQKMNILWETFNHTQIKFIENNYNFKIDGFNNNLSICSIFSLKYRQFNLNCLLENLLVEINVTWNWCKMDKCKPENVKLLQPKLYN